MMRESIEAEGRRIAEELGVIYNGPQYSDTELYFHVFTDPLTGGTFAATSKVDAWTRFFRLREEFGAPAPENVPPDMREFILRLRGAMAREMRERGLMDLTLEDLAESDGNPLRKFCCRECGDCAPAELLEEGKFPERIAWLRRHYKEKHPGLWGHVDGGNPIDHCQEARAAMAKYEADVKAGHTEAAQYWKGQADVHALQCAVGGGDIAMAKPKTESERKSWHERIFGAGSTPPGERRGLGQTTNDLMPMPPQSGPPLPRALGIKWPWSK